MKVSNKDTVDLQSVKGAGKSRRSEAADKAKAADADIMPSKGGAANVELSSDAKMLSRGIDAAKGAEVSDKEKIAAIKAKIKDGNYNPDFGEVADKMLTEHILNG